jgi:hypothetical protein
VSPFDELNKTDQQCAIDVAVAVSILSVRIPAANNKTFYDWVIKEFAVTNTLPQNLARYALKHVGTALFNNDWAFSVEKSNQQFTTRFRQITADGTNGEKVES